MRSLQLELRQASVTEARHFLTRVTAGWWSAPRAAGDEAGLDIARLLLTELVTNAVVHAPDGEHLQVVVCRCDGRLRVEVHDGSALMPLVREATNEDESGRGTLLLEQLAEQWGAEPQDERGGKTVWFTVPL